MWYGLLATCNPRTCSMQLLNVILARIVADLPTAPPRDRHIKHQMNHMLVSLATFCTTLLSMLKVYCQPFSTFASFVAATKLDRRTDIQTDELTYRQTNGRTDRQTDIQTDERLYRQTNRHLYITNCFIAHTLEEYFSSFILYILLYIYIYLGHLSVGVPANIEI